MSDNNEPSEYSIIWTVKDGLSMFEVSKICGASNVNLKLIEKRFLIRIFHRGYLFRLVGDRRMVELANSLLDRLEKHVARSELDELILRTYLDEILLENIPMDRTKTEDILKKTMTDSRSPEKIHVKKKLSVGEAVHTIQGGVQGERKIFGVKTEPIRERVISLDDVGRTLKHQIKTPKVVIEPKTPHQIDYLKSLREKTVTFGIGPAGTGKTFIAVLAAVEALLQQRVEKLILVRPAVEAGEKLGFLPGDMEQKIDPYLRPLFDALHLALGVEQVLRWQEQQRLEIAPLAFMRGRTLSKAFIILDEAQNASVSQMKMFLTRIGFGSVVAVTGDMTQVDLGVSERSGLAHAVGILEGIDDIAFHYFTDKDVRRHELVRRILQAYEHSEGFDVNNRNKRTVRK